MQTSVQRNEGTSTPENIKQGKYTCWFGIVVLVWASVS